MNTGVISNAKVVLADQISENADVVIRDGLIESISPCQRERSAAVLSDFSAQDFWIFDAEGHWLIPGLIDLHVHGAGGSDTMDATPASLETMARTLLAQGTTAFLATTMSSSPERLNAVLANVAAYKSKQQTGAEILGIHMEGPFLAPAFKGAQAAEAIYPLEALDEADVFAQLAARYPGLIRILTLAVERPGAARLIRNCHEHGVIPSVGHSAASYEQMQQAFRWGVRQLTHAFNAMPSIHHRRPGLLTEALKNPEIRMELIADGVHIHPAVLELALYCKPAESIVLVSDGTRAVGMPDGQYDLGGQLTTVKQGMALLADGTIAGSAFPLLQGVKTLVSIGYNLPRAINHASLYPARLLGVSDRLGSIEPGKQASLVQLDSDLNVKNVWLRGERIESKCTQEH